MIYRALKRLEVKDGIVEAGALFPASLVNTKSREILEGRAIIARIGAPPLVEIPGWKERGELLAAEGISDCEQFLEADAATIESVLNAPGKAGALKTEITGWLTVPRPRC